jgi:transposase
MIVIGVDVSKDALVAVAIDKSIRIKNSFTVENKREEIEKWLNGLCYKKLLLSCEATAEYHRVLALLALSRKIPLRLLNPIVTKQYTKATVRKRKTDPQDALTIAKLALAGEGRLISSQTFQIAKTHERTAIKLSHTRQRLLLIQQHIQEIDSGDEDSIKQLQVCIDTIEESIKVFRKKAEGEVNAKEVKLLCSIPGIGETISTVLLAEIGDINQFRSAKALVAYAGLDPKVKQSGGRLHHNTHLTKRGSPYLRQMLYTGASIAQRCDKELKTYYEKKRSEGKRYKEATVAVSRKLLNRVYAVLKRKSPYYVSG